MGSWCQKWLFGDQISLLKAILWLKFLSGFNSFYSALKAQSSSVRKAKAIFLFLIADKAIYPPAQPTTQRMVMALSIPSVRIPKHPPPPPPWAFLRHFTALSSPGWGVCRNRSAWGWGIVKSKFIYLILKDVHALFILNFLSASNVKY